MNVTNVTNVTNGLVNTTRKVMPTTQASSYGNKQKSKEETQQQTPNDDKKSDKTHGGFISIRV